MKNTSLPLQGRKRAAFAYLLTCSILSLAVQFGSSQCVTQPGTIEGFVFKDANNNGIKDPGEVPVSNVRVQAVDGSGSTLSTVLTDINGLYALKNLPDGKEVRLTYQHTDYYDGFAGSDNGTRVQFVTVPACSKGLGLTSSLQYCDESTRILTTCFVQGSVNALPAEPTIVGLNYGFNLGTPAEKFAMYSETGTIWGVAWNKREKALYSAAFIKQYGGLTAHGHDAIFKTNIPDVGMPSTSLFVKLSQLGQNTGSLTTTDINHCDYGAQVGKIGLGALEISADQKTLYTVNLYNNTLVAIPTVNPSAANTKAYQIPDPGCSDSEYRAFALKMYNDKLYVGVTCTGETAKDESASSVHVYEFNPASKQFTLIFSTGYARGYWRDSQPSQIFTMHWLTDIDFTDDGHMLLALSDRTGHRYCTVNFTNRLDDQRPDLLLVGYNKTTKTWTLENNGSVAGLTGSGVGNGEGPGGGEFFGKDHWPKDPAYHPEVALGSIFVMPGTNSVVAAVFDPHLNAYSGGLHRYSTRNGDLLGVKELYRLNTTVAFGKATGFGDLVATCTEPAIEIGNRVWADVNKNGIQDAGEPGMSGIGLWLYDENCAVLAKTQTANNGQYSFNNNNVSAGLNAGSTYYIGIDPSLYDGNAELYVSGGEYYNLTKQQPADVITGNKAQASVAGCQQANLTVQTTFSDQNFDIGLAKASECGMNITASLVNADPVKVSDVVSFDLCVTNTGVIPVRSYTIEHTMPNGTMFDPSVNPEWTNNGIINTFVRNITLGKGQTYCTKIHVRFNDEERNLGMNQQFTITEALDINGQVIDLTGSCGATAETLQSIVTPGIFDLALKHELAQAGVFSHGSEIKINTTVYNQGNTASSAFTLVNYLNEEFDFDPAKNPGWRLSQDGRLLTFENTEALYPGENKTFMLIFTLKTDAKTGAIVNYSEITSSFDDAGNAATDFDSDADDDVKNDNGGEVNSLTDNMITDHGKMDEDDHDPLVVLLDVVDVAIVKKARNREIIPGKESLFDLEIINQGTVAIRKFVLRDYIPAGLSLQDENWISVPGNIAEREITLEKPLQPGESAFTTINLLVSATLTGPAVLTNVVQVFKIYDTELTEISDLDVDSNLSLIVENNQNNVFAYLGQDNYSAADVVLLGLVEVGNPCRCLNNASTPFDGQFSIGLAFESASGEEWHIQQVTGLYDEFSAQPPALPTPFITGPAGFILDEQDLGNGISRYSMAGIHVEGEGFFIVAQNNFGLTRSYRLEPGTCRYETVNIEGLVSVCNTTTTTYSVDLFGEDYEFVWTLDGNPIGGDENTVSIDWNTILDGQHILRLEINGAAYEECFSPSTLNVASGEGDASAISCISNINVSLNENCTFTVTPAVLIAGQFNEGSPYQVILMDKDGKVIPNATLSIEHLGQNIMAKLIDGCGGNSCWATVFVEDKIPPFTFCQDIVLACHELDTYVGPFESDNCGGEVTNILLSEYITTYTCNPDYIKQIDRTYIAKDKAGNTSVPCEMTIYVARPNLRQIVMPADRTMANGNPLVCSQFPVDNNGRPSTEVTGVPTLFDVPLFPIPLESCNIFVGYSDRVIGKINCTTKIAREWVIYEHWCTNTSPLILTQLIEITDTIPPVIEPVADITVSASKGNCLATVQLPEAIVSDECEGVLNVTIEYPGGFVQGQTTATVLLPSGDNLITYTVYDECGNSSSETYTITVEDKTAPTVICKGEVVVSLNFQGEAYLRPVNINDGSWDACGISHFEVRRMTDSCGTGTNVFGPLVDFCCEDVGDTVIVEMKVTDLHNNSNTCMIPVTVQDKFAPQITCPDDVEISCDTPIDLEDLDIYGVAQAIDACGAVVEELAPVSGLNQCRQGIIERRFIATDDQGSASCSQYIHVVNYDPFSPADIVKPLDYETDKGCTPLDLHPDNLPAPYNYPVITEDFCDNVGVTFDDQVFNFVQNACFKIVRTWYVIDWCAMENDSLYEPYTFQQTIKVQNYEAPVITSSCEPVNACTPKDNCVDGFIELTATATDVCTPGNLLSRTYKIDLNNDGIYEDEVTGFGDEIDASGIYPVGSHRIQYSFEDRCGNVTTCDQLFSIQNCDTPTAICVERISIGLVPMDMDGDGENEIEMACVNAASLDAGSYHACSEDLCFAFSATDTTFTEYCFDCFDVGIIDITLYVIDKIGGGVSECVVSVEVQDNNDEDVCPDLEDCIVWPDSVQFTGCAPIIGTIGFDKIPVLQTDCDCNDVTVTHEDNPPVPCGPRCTTTSRIWTVTFNCYSRPISYTFSQIITVFDDTPDATISGNNNICRGRSTTLTAGGGGTYLWSTGQTTTSITVSPMQNTVYRVTVTSSLGCQDVAEITVVVNPLPNVVIQGNRTICVNQSTTLTATGGTFFTWSTGQMTASITVNPLVTTNYTVTVTDTNGCSATSTATVTVNSLPSVTIQGTSPICLGQSTTLTASGGTSYVWSTGQTSASITVSPPSTQAYTVTVTNQNTCSNTGSFNVVVNPLPVVNVTGNNIICTGQSTTLTASGGTSYLWSNGQTTASVNVAPVQTTTYTVTVTNTNGCSATGSRTVTVNPRPDANIVGDTIICIGESTTLTATGGGTYVWSTGQTTASITVAPTQMTTYSVTVTNANQCTDVASVSVEVGTGQVTCETRDTTLYLDDMGMVLITPELISVGDTTGCNGEILVEVDPGIFFCNQVGINEVTLFVINVTTNDTLTCFADVTVLDTIPPTVICPNDTILGCLEYDPNQPITIFGEASVDDNCQVGLELDETTIPNLNVCNVGVITRTFVATDNSGNSSQCVQTITIEPTNPITEDNITWPQDTLTIGSCENTDPEFTGMPEVDDQGADCANISIDFADLNLPPDGSGCADTIIRTWTVIDSCQMEAGTNNGIFTFTQVIFVVDTTAPVLSNLPPPFIEVTLEVGQCSVFVDMSGIIATDCDTNLIVSNNGFWAVDQNSLDPSGSYDAGIYPITITAQDECGNVAEYNITLVIHAFRFLCTKQFLLMPDTCEFREPAIKFYAFDNVCPQSNHFLGSYTLNPADSIRILDCGDVSPVGQDVTIHLWDIRSGDTILWDTCRTQYFFTDPDNHCANCQGGRVNLTGTVATILNIPVAGVDVNINNSSVKTNNAGVYKDGSMMIGEQYDVAPRKTSDVLEGVTTLDLVLMQRHITGIGLLENPYNILAGDINNDRKFNTVDLVELRKTILGVYSAFPNNDSWRMIPSTFSFIDDTNPFVTPVPGSYFIESMPGNMRVDFTGVKVGDVNNTYAVNSTATDNRTGDDLILQIEDRHIKHRGSVISLPVRNMTDIELHGFQFALDVQGLTNISVLAGELKLKPEHYNVQNGYLYISWSDMATIHLKGGEILFTIEAATKQNGQVSAMVKLEPAVMRAESYNAGLNVNGVYLNYGHESDGQQEFMVIGNAPNPWSQMTTVRFYVPQTGDVELSVRDITGKLIVQRSAHFDKGVQAFDIYRNELNNTGVFMYELKFNDNIRTGKMVLIE